MFENTEKALIVMLLAIRVKLGGEDGHVKKRKKRFLDETMVKKLSTHNCIPNIFQGLRFKDKEGTPN